MNKFQVGDATVILVKGDITDMPVDAIVNAADSSLMGGGGVDGAIHRKGGPRILEECKQLRARDWPKGLPTGKAALTSGGDLKAKCVIHTVGPCGPAEATEKLGCWLRLMLARSSWQVLRSLSLLPFHR